MKPFSFVDFEREAQAILAGARERANAILQQAMVEAGHIREKAREEGVEAGRREASGLLGEVVRRVEERRAELSAEAERDLVRLAVAIAGRIVKSEVALGRPVAEANLRRAIELAAHRHGLRVLAHPDDLKRLAGIDGLVVEGDLAVQPGGVVVKTVDGGVDADLRTQLDQIERGLLE